MIENAYFIVKGTKSNQSVTDIKAKLDTLHGVTSAAVDAKTNLVSVRYNSAGTSYDKIENYLNKMGYQIAADASDIHTR
ncbi:cation transporter [Hydrogenoanaerobacterium sp.]|uniref:heavy-metal-associated domain-containing protein n=1 Tax=Hydrogenoanaerobacterium sp. TaxID=2953763 RepID=UPI00289E127A|nr:cation transporter [Hydrogenoanaerobacterium sp.]